MKFSFIGLNSISRPLADAILADPAHELVAMYAIDDSAFQASYPGVHYEKDWEPVLHNCDSDIVVISPTNDPAGLEERLRKVVQCGLPTVTTQPYCSVLAAFEMAMIQAQTGQPLISYSPVDHHPTAQTLGHWIVDPDSSPIGEISQIAIHTFPESRQQKVVLQAFAYDVPIVRNIAGRIRQINAMSGTVDHDPFVNLHITLKTDSPLLVTWQLDPSVPNGQRTLHLTGATGNSLLSLTDNNATWESADNVSSQLPSKPSLSPATRFLAELPDVLANSAADDSWLNWCQDLEIADTVPICLRRRRTIDILDEQRNEEGSFKGVMSIGGCALLLATLLFLLAGTIFEGFRFPSRKRAYELDQPTAATSMDPISDERSIWIRFWPAYPFLLFLLLQLLRTVIHPPGSQLSGPAQREPPT